MHLRGTLQMTLNYVSISGKQQITLESGPNEDKSIESLGQLHKEKAKKSYLHDCTNRINFNYLCNCEKEFQMTATLYFPCPKVKKASLDVLYPRK